MINVRLDSPFTNWPLLRQTPGSSGEWGRYRFEINSACTAADAWVVLHDVPVAARCVTSPSRTILFNIEPPLTMRYPAAFLRQFGAIHTCGGFAFRHQRILEGQPAVPWWIGVKQSSPHVAAASGHRGTYDEFEEQRIGSKSKLISVISSNRLISRRHVQRAKFIDELEDRLGSDLHVLGPRPGEPDAGWINKWDAIAPFRYHIAIENSEYPHYWTEKLADPLLVDTHPFYSGCPNVGQYFDGRALTPIPIDDPKRAVETIRRGIDEDLWSHARDARWQARGQILNRYNIFAEIAAILDASPIQGSREVVIRPVAQSTGRISKLYWSARHLAMQRSGIRRLLGRSG